MVESKTRIVAAALGLLALVVVGCAPKSPEEKVAQLRSFYTARPVGFIVDAQPVEPVEAMTPEEGAEPSDLEAPVEGEEPVEAEPVPMRQDVHLDILLQHDSPEKLAGITLDVIMVDGEQVEKERWRVWVETAELPKATGTQFTHVLEDIDYVEGDAFSVEVRHPIPAEERGDYKEFASAGV